MGKRYQFIVLSAPSTLTLHTPTPTETMQDNRSHESENFEDLILLINETNNFTSLVVFIHVFL